MLGKPKSGSSRGAANGSGGTVRPADELLDLGAGHTALELQVDQAELVVCHPGRTRERPFVVSGPAWSAAEPDLLADEESMHLTHLVHAHQPALAMLRWALEPELRSPCGPPTTRA